MSSATAATIEPPPSPKPSVAKGAVVALIGNPNSGKTTLFNALTGARARVGNYSGVTVEHREADLDLGEDTRIRLVDLPGTYSLVPRAEDEQVALHGLLGRLPGVVRPSLVIAVVDATSLDRNLYVLALLRELGVPLVVALTMMDTMESDGLKLNVDLLSRRFGVPMVPVSALRGTGLDALQKAVRQALASGVTPLPLPAPIPSRPDLDEMGRLVGRDLGLTADPTALGVWALSLTAGGVAGTLGFGHAARDGLAKIVDAPAVVQTSIAARYKRVSEWTADVLTRTSPAGPTPSERLTARIDAFALHRVFGPILLIFIFGGLFQALFTWSKPIMDAVQDAVGWGGDTIAAFIPDGFPLLKSLLLNGIVAGVGNVIVFVPQIAVLFFCLGVLEDSGYLARAAFLLDRLLSRVGLHGRAFIPMLSGFACAVPAVLAARTIENRKDRLVTILVTPLVSCSARLPVYGLMIATVFSTQPHIFGVIHPGAVVMIAMYTLSITAALGMAALFKRTILKTPPPPFVLELPPYRRPRFRSLARHVWGKVIRFLKDAGTVILALTVVLWGLFNFPRSAKLDSDQETEIAFVQTVEKDETAREAKVAEVEGRFARERLEYSVAGRVGHAIEPLIKPMGWDWKVGVGLLASFAAREVLVSTLGLVYGLGEGAEDNDVSLQESMRKDRDPLTGKPVHTPLSGLSLMVFFVLAMQCMSTMAIVRRETGSWKWAAFQFAYMLVLAVSASLLVFQGGKLLGFA